MKDDVLHFLIEKGKPNFTIDVSSMAKELDIDIDFIDIILEQFTEKRLIETTLYGGYEMLFNLKAGAYDLYAHGGFAGIEDLFQKNLDKLESEIESLRPKFPEKAVQFATILSGLTSYLALFKR